MIVDKIMELLSKDIDNEDSSVLSLLDTMGKDIIWSVTRQVFTKRFKAPTLRCSSLGKCIRQQAYTVLDYPVKPITPRAKMTFLFGDIVEAIVVVLAKSAGVNLHSEQKEVEFCGVKGHIDGIINEDTLFECKSMSDYSFNNFKKYGISDDTGYISQCNVYMHALNLKKACLVGVNKNTGHMHEQIIYPDKILLDKLRSNIANINLLTEDKISLEDLPRLKPIEETFYRKKTGNLKLEWRCSYCDYVEHCWEDNLILAFKNNKPIYYIKNSFNKDNMPKGTKLAEDKDEKNNRV